MYGMLSQDLAAEQIRDWQRQAIQHERVRQARRNRAAARGWRPWGRRPWPAGPVPGKPAAASPPPALAAVRPAGDGRSPAAAGERQPAGHRAA